VLLIVLAQLSGVYINYLWYGSVGHHNVYSTLLWTKVSLFFIFGVLMALIIGGNLVIAYAVRPPFRPMSPEQQNLQNYALILEPRRKLILTVVSLIALLAAGASAQGNWAMWQLWLHGTSFHQTDPQFGRDISFYAFDYPVYRNLLGFGFTGIIFALVLSVVVHYLTGAIRLQTPGPKMTIAARRHVTILVFAFMALKAEAYWLDRYGLVFSGRSKFTGASYTDVHAELPAKTILFWIAIILALGVLASMWLRSALLPGIGFVVLLVLSILIGGIYPAILQSVSVKPNASDKERPYIERNINATRAAYDIATYDPKTKTGSVHYADYAATTDPSATSLTSTNTTVDNLRILDPNVISPTFTNAQKIVPYYGFSPRLDVDRYMIDGQTHDYVVAARQLRPQNLSGSLNNWINQYTVYTHGYGFVAARANEDVTNSAPSAYTEGDIPPAGPLHITQPDVYYGQAMNPYAIVGAQGRHREYDGSGNYVTYAGKGGVSLSSLLTRLAFAFNYKQTNFVLNDAVSAPGARIIINRDPLQLVHKVAPFLTLDGDPYPVVDQASGHIVWIVDGYTTMANYPYSARQSLSALTGTSQRRDQANTQINYIRNSVKATVDAYDGTVHLYDWDPGDPLLQSWMRIFPGLIQPATSMPSAIRAHIRYPQDLFNVQRALLAQYHINDAVAFYNGRGRWSVPADPFDPASGDQPPYYVLASPPDSSSNKPEFQLTSPMTVFSPSGQNQVNLAAYISADCDPGPDYGRITVLKVVGGGAIQGPGQVANVFRTNSRISSDITLLGRGESNVVHGNLLTLPLGDSFLYVEPLYVESTYPVLSRVLVTYGNQIGYAANLQDALDDIRLHRQPGSTLNENGTTNPPGGSTSSPPPTSTSNPSSGTSNTPPPGSGSTSVPPDQVQLLQQINADFQQSARAFKRGDVSAGFAAQARAQKLIERYLSTYGSLPSGRSSGAGSSTPAPPSPSP
jgi:uncharacterized membrane protein (UPF0182 family)